MNLSQRIRAAKIRLGIQNTVLTTEAVRAAAAAKLKADHPDHGGDGSNTDRVKKDREFLLRHCSDQIECPHCNGTGFASE
jgi:hypothetical protein